MYQAPQPGKVDTLETWIDSSHTQTTHTHTHFAKLYYTDATVAISFVAQTIQLNMPLPLHSVCQAYQEMERGDGRLTRGILITRGVAPFLKLPTANNKSEQ